MTRLFLLIVLGASLATPIFAQRERQQPPGLPSVHPDPIAYDQVEAALDEANIAFEQIHILSFDLLETELVTEIYLARQEDPENQRVKLVWVADFVNHRMIQTDRFDAMNGWRFRFLQRKLTRDQLVVARQVEFFRSNGPIWLRTALPRVKKELPGGQIYYHALQIDDLEQDVDYRLFFDVLHQGELKRIVYASVNDEAVLEYLGPAPANYRIKPFDSRNPVVMDPDADTRAPEEGEDAGGD